MVQTAAAVMNLAGEVMRFLLDCMACSRDRKTLTVFSPRDRAGGRQCLQVAGGRGEAIADTVHLVATGLACTAGEFARALCQRLDNPEELSEVVT